MTLSELATFFGPIGQFRLDSVNAIQGRAFSDDDPVLLTPQDGRSFLVETYVNGHPSGIHYTFATATDKEAEQLRRHLQGSYLARIHKVSEGSITVAALATPSLDLDNESIDIACGKGELMQISKRGSELFNNYCYEHGDKTYFVMGKISALAKKDSDGLGDSDAEDDPNATIEQRTKKSNFTLCGLSGRIDVNVKRRKDLGDCDEEPESELDEIFYADKQVKGRADRARYVFSLTGKRFVFVNYTKAAIAAKAQQVLLKDTDGLGRYLSLWKQYNNLEERYVNDLFDHAGTLKAEIVSDPRSDGKTLFRFNVLGRHDDYVKFVTSYEKLGKENQIRVKIPDALPGVKDFIADVDSYPSFSSTEQYFFLRINNPKFSISKAQYVEIEMSRQAFDLMFERREIAINTLAEGKAANHWLPLILSGKNHPLPGSSNKRLTLSLETSRRTFGIHGPTPSQRKAIEAAINTPDIAIIQGPPGTGKSTVIQAIESILSSNSNNKAVYFGKNLVTAYQNDAVDNVAEKLTTLYGFPAMAFMRRDSSDTFDIRRKEWVSSLTKKIQIRNPNSVALTYTRESYIRFLNHRRTYAADTFTYAEDLTFLYTLKSLLMSDPEAEQRDRLSEFLCGDTKELIALMTQNQIAALKNIASAANKDIIDVIQNQNGEIINNHSVEELQLLRKEASSAFSMLSYRCPKSLIDEKQEEQLASLIERAARESLNTSGLNYSRYYASLWNLPLSQVAYEDNGKATVDETIYRLKNYSPAFYNQYKAQIDRLESHYAVTPIDFPTVAKEVCALMAAVVPSRSYSVPVDFNKEIEEFLENVMHNDTNIDPIDRAIADFIISLHGSESEVDQSIIEFSSTIVATHQKVDSKEVVLRKAKTENKDFYENVIVDEAARSSPPDLLIPLVRAAKKIILVGDQNQLPQLINEEIYNKLDDSNGGFVDKSLLKKSMFEHLIDICLEYEKMDGMTRVVRLNEQFRMPKTLGDFIGRNFYAFDMSGKKIEGTPLVTCTLPSKFPIGIKELENCSMGFVDCPGEREAQDYSKSKYRKEEARQIAIRLKRYFEESEYLGKRAPKFAVMAFYRRQIEEIYRELENVGIASRSGTNAYEIKDEYASRIMVGTVDSFQGRQYDVVLVSMTRNPNIGSGRKKGGFGFLRSMNRQCVALSRAKRCCILFASRDAFDKRIAEEQIPALYDFYKTCVNKEAPDAKEL